MPLLLPPPLGVAPVADGPIARDEPSKWAADDEPARDDLELLTVGLEPECSEWNGQEEKPNVVEGKGSQIQPSYNKSSESQVKPSQAKWVRRAEVWSPHQDAQPLLDLALA